MKHFTRSKILSWLLIMLFAVQLNSCNFMQISSVKNNKNKKLENAGLNPKKLDVFVDTVEPSQSGELHNEILEVFSKRHALKKASLKKAVFVRDFRKSANKALKNRGIAPLVTNEYVESVINELGKLKEKGIYDFSQLQKVQDKDKLLSYFEQNGTITQDDIEKTKKLITLIKHDKSSLKRADLHTTMQKKLGEKQSKKIIRAADVAASSAIFWDNVKEKDGEFVGNYPRTIVIILADALGGIIGGPIGAAVVSLAFLLMWWLLDNGYR